MKKSIVGQNPLPSSLRVSVLPSVVEYLYDELDGVSDFVSPVDTTYVHREKERKCL